MMVSGVSAGIAELFRFCLKPSISEDVDHTKRKYPLERSPDRAHFMEHTRSLPIVVKPKRSSVMTHVALRLPTKIALNTRARLFLVSLLILPGRPALAAAPQVPH